MGDPLEDQLRRTARAFTGATEPGEPAAGGLGEVRTRSARRRRTRRAVRSTAVGALALVAVVGVVRLPRNGDTDGVNMIGGAPDGQPESPDQPADPQHGTEGTTPGTEVTPLPSAPVPSAPTGVSPPTSALPPPPVTATTLPAGARGGPLEVRADGLGAAAFGQPVDTAVASLVATLGQPDNPGTVGNGTGRCGVIHTRDVRWGDLTVSFTDTGSGLKLSGYYWGIFANRNATGAHTPPAGPGSPLLGNPWGLRQGTRVPSVDDLVGQVRRTFPQASYVETGNLDPSVSTPLGERYLHIVLHLTPESGKVVESIWALTPREVVCN